MKQIIFFSLCLVFNNFFNACVLSVSYSEKRVGLVSGLWVSGDQNFIIYNYIDLSLGSISLTFLVKEKGKK